MVMQSRFRDCKKVFSRWENHLHRRPDLSGNPWHSPLFSPFHASQLPHFSPQHKVHWTALGASSGCGTACTSLKFLLTSKTSLESSKTFTSPNYISWKTFLNHRASDRMHLPDWKIHNLGAGYLTEVFTHWTCTMMNQKGVPILMY